MIYPIQIHNACRDYWNSSRHWAAHYSSGSCGCNNEESCSNIEIPQLDLVGTLLDLVGTLLDLFESLLDLFESLLLLVEKPESKRFVA